jgi:uracil-DNA glycosylase
MQNINGWLLPDAPRLDGPFYPARRNVFRAFELVAPASVKVVILGQDPYPSADGEGNPKASGLAFSLSRDWKGKALHSSFGNIVEELARCNFRLASSDYNLENWARQGVLLLNTQLTVAPGKPLSHEGVWDSTIGAALLQLPITNVVWLTWGRPARNLALKFHRGTQELVSTTHPCKFSHARSTNSLPAFTGSGCFQRVNELLVQKFNVRPIVWGRYEQQSDISEAQAVFG